MLAPRVHSWKTRQSARAGRALEEGGTVLSSPPLLSCSAGPALTAALRPSPQSGARGCHAHSEGRSGFCTVPPGFGDSTKAERGRSWKARHGSLEKHITNGDGDSGPRSRTATKHPARAPSPMLPGHSSMRMATGVWGFASRRPIPTTIAGDRDRPCPRAVPGLSWVSALLPAGMPGPKIALRLWLPGPLAALSPGGCYLVLLRALSCHWLGVPSHDQQPAGSAPLRQPLLKPPGPSGRRAWMRASLSSPSAPPPSWGAPAPGHAGTDSASN